MNRNILRSYERQVRASGMDQCDACKIAGHPSELSFYVSPDELVGLCHTCDSSMGDEYRKAGFLRTER